MQLLSFRPQPASLWQPLRSDFFVIHKESQFRLRYLNAIQRKRELLSVNTKHR